MPSWTESATVTIVVVPTAVGTLNNSATVAANEAETNLANIIASLGSAEPPALIVIDSVQTLWSESVDAAPGTISQLRGCASALISQAKTSGSTLVLVDDVLTSGATVDGCARTLLRGGAVSVDVLVFARVVAGGRAPI